MLIEPTTLISDLDQMLILSLGRPWSLSKPGRLGPLAVEVTLSREGERLRLDLQWTNDSSLLLEDVVVGIEIALDLPEPRVTIPQVIYHDNPSADPTRPIPHVGRGGFVTQEHRLPIPAVNVESRGQQVTLTSLPSSDRDSDGNVRYGSLGAIVEGDQVKIIALSGPVLFDGQPDVDYVHKAEQASTVQGYRDLAPGESLSKSILLETGPVDSPGHGFRALASVGEDVFRPQGSAGPPLEELINLKAAALDARWYQDGDVAGYVKFPAWGEPRRRAGRPEHEFLYGWTGQCLRLAWCDARLGVERSEPWRLDRARAAVDFYVTGSTTEVAGLRKNFYVADSQHWQGFRHDHVEMVSSRAHGETLGDLTDVIVLFREHDLVVPQTWVDAVTQGADFILSALLPTGIAPLGWDLAGQPLGAMASASGIPAAQAVLDAYVLTDDSRYLAGAQAMAAAYHAEHTQTFDRPFAHSTLDAACEDKEGGLYYFLLVVELWRLTGEDRFRERAELVADWLLTWVYHWSPEFDHDAPLHQRGFTSAGWPGVSVQNHHLDVFFPTYELWWLGREIGNEHYVRMAELIMGAMGQGICTAPGEWGFDVVGEQTEAFFVTNWQKRGHSNNWNPSWVIALPLWHALRLTG